MTSPRTPTDSPPSARRQRPERAVPVLGTLVAYTLRACLPGRRRLGLLLPVLGALLFGLLAHVVVADSDQEAFAVVASAGLFSIVLPIGCLVIGDAVLGAEVRAGTLLFTWLSPVARWAIVLARWAGGTLVASLSMG
ncbi:MAG: hypothetical protein LC733_04935, partial [Actinobacteria bacterium]|nr:hypothetical protein [Actinomycetota bacterium]